MGYKVDYKRMNKILAQLSEKYVIYGPKFDGQRKRVRYAPVKEISEIVYDRQSDFSIKEAFYPISQVMYYFRSDVVTEGEVSDDRDILIFARPCDINGISRLDAIFLENGKPDFYYARLRRKVRIAMIECKESFENCFCVSTGTNIAKDYDFAVRFGEKILIDVKAKDFLEYFDWEEEADFEPEYVSENKKKLVIPNISRANLKPISDLEYWKQFDETCVGCGGCNTVCGTCSCFDTNDITYDEGGTDGERRRVWSSCMIPHFTETAGGHRSRPTQGANMRFKVFHKFYDFKARFGKENMCTGCGRCDIRCPQKISFFDTVNNLNAEIEEMNAEAENTAEK